MSAISTPNKEPVAYQSAFLVIMNLLIAFHFVHFTIDQVATLNTAYAFFSTYFVRRSVTPTADPKDNQGNTLVPAATR